MSNVLREDDYTYIIKCEYCDKELVYAKRIKLVNDTEYTIRKPKRLVCMPCHFEKKGA
jgi:hypothetical protein